MSATVVDALIWWGKRTPDAPALILRDDEIAYGALDAWVARAASALVDQGVQPGDRVGVFGQSSLAWCVSALAALRVGAIALPVNPRLVEAEVVTLVEQYEPRLIVADEFAAERVSAALAKTGSFTPVPMADIAALRDADAPTHRYEPLDARAPAVIINTSGTTGRSKGVVFAHSALVSPAQEWGLVEPHVFRPGISILLVLPLTFHAGFVSGLSMAVTFGGRLVIEPDLKGDTALAAIEKHRVEQLFGPPIVFETIAAAPGFADANLSSLIAPWVGGARVPAELLRTWLAKGVKLRQIYGLTEAGGAITATPSEDAEQHPDSCGPGGMYTVVRVVRPDGTECEPGEAGEIILRGPSMLSGYWNDPETTAFAIRDGWLHTGDLGVFIDGRLKPVDRLKDLIISGGINVSPAEIEEVISTLEGVEEVVVIPVADARFGETPAAIVYGQGIDAKAVVDHCNAQMADFKVPRYVVINDEPLPRLPAGKLARADLKKSYADIPTRFEKVR